MPADLTERLQHAINKLEMFSRQAMRKLSENPLKKTISIFKAKIVESFSDGLFNEKIADNPEDILNAVELISRERLWIQKLKMGSPTERSLAESFFKAIENYNRIREKYYEKKKQKRRIPISIFENKHEPTFSHLPKIDLLQPLVKKFQFAISNQEPVADLSAPKPEVCDNKEHQAANPLSQRSAELFQMKTLSLLEQYGIASNPEARTHVKQSPIYATYIPGSRKYTLSQTLSLFPGQTIIVKGNTELDSGCQSIQRLFPESFSVFMESSQTGFPHPLQRAGWTLANELLPNYPQRIDLIPRLESFFQAKIQIASDLLPQKRLFHSSKNLLKLKRGVFNSNKTEFLELHYQFAECIVKLSFGDNYLAKSIVEAYFAELSLEYSPYDALSEVYQYVQKMFISNPYHFLFSKVIEKENSKTNPLNYLISYEVLKNSQSDSVARVEKCIQNSTSQKERSKWTFIELMGAAFGPPSQTIMLQYLSEDLAFRPPLLDPFAKKIQSAAYCHVEDFVQELNSTFNQDQAIDEHFIYESLKTKMASDIKLFNSNHYHGIVDDLADYYSLRYQIASLPAVNAERL